MTRTMFELMEKIKTFLAARFEADEDFETPIAVNDEYMFNHELGNTEVQTGFLDNSEYERLISFEGEQGAYMPIQLTVYSTQMKIGGKTYNPRDTGVIVADKICRYMKYLSREVCGILLCERTDYTSPYPMNEGATRYFVALRYDLVVDSPYRE